jgi:hypothetical protein
MISIALAQAAKHTYTGALIAIRRIEEFSVRV